TATPTSSATALATSTATANPTATSTATPTLTATATPSLSANCPGTLQSLIDAAPAGSTVTLPACIYRGTVSFTKSLTLDGQHRAEIRGSDVWLGWTQSGATWISTLAYPNVGDDSTAGTAPCSQGGPCYLDHFKAFNLEQVFIDGAALVHVPLNPT